MPDAVALLGLFLFWASLVWLPLTGYRAVLSRGKPQIWAIAGIFAFGMVLMGYTRAMQTGAVNEAFAWSVAWIMPLGLAIYARATPDAPLRPWDKWVFGGVLLSFAMIAPLLPRVLRVVSDAIWT